MFSMKININETIYRSASPKIFMNTPNFLVLARNTKNLQNKMNRRIVRM